MPFMLLFLDYRIKNIKRYIETKDNQMKMILEKLKQIERESIG